VCCIRVVWCRAVLQYIIMLQGCVAVEQYIAGVCCSRVMCCWGVYACMHIHTHTHSQAHTAVLYACVFVCVNVYVCWCMFLYAYVCKCVCQYVCVYVCFCVCVFVCHCGKSSVQLNNSAKLDRAYCITSFLGRLFGSKKAGGAKCSFRFS